MWMMRLGCAALLLGLSFLVSAQTIVPDQVFDVRSYNFDSQPTVKIDHGWRLYANKLLTPMTLGSRDQSVPLGDGPGWSGTSAMDDFGFATYRITLQLPHNHSGLSLYFPIINASSRVWLNGKRVASTGAVAETPERYRAELTTLLIPLPDKEETVDVLIQVANFTNPGGGFSDYPRIDRTADLVDSNARSNGIQNFFTGCLIAMALYQLILFSLYRKGRPFLWLALICLGVATRAVVLHGGSLLLPRIFPDVTWEVWKKLEYGSVYAIVAFFPLYVYDLFPHYANKKFLIFFVVLGILSTGLVVITSQIMFRVVLEIVHVAYLLSFVYAFLTISRAWKGGETDAKIILFGIVVSFPFILLEILKNSVLINLDIPSMYYVELGVLVFLLFQVYLLANHQALSHKALEIMNVNLEGIVHERTRELRTANDVRDRLLSVISHDVRSPLNSLQGMLDLYNKGHITADEFSQFSKQIQAQLGSTNLLVENMLVWTAAQLKDTKPQRKEFDLKELVDHNMGLFHSTAISKGVVLDSHVLTSCRVTWDKNIMHLALRNLVANAIKFSHEGGRIEIDSETSHGELHVSVTDHGVGMDSVTLDTILTSHGTTSREGTGKERGAGIGLSLVREYVVHAGGRLSAQSKEGEGSRFTLAIPV